MNHHQKPTRNDVCGFVLIPALVLILLCAFEPVREPVEIVDSMVFECRIGPWFDIAPIVYRSGHQVFILVSGVRFSVGAPCGMKCAVRPARKEANQNEQEL